MRQRLERLHGSAKGASPDIRLAERLCLRLRRDTYVHQKGNAAGSGLRMDMRGCLQWPKIMQQSRVAGKP